MKSHMPTPTETQLEYEVTLARTDLEANLNQLKHLVQETLDPSRLAHEALDKAKAKAHEIADLKLLQAKLWYAKTRDRAIEIAGDKKLEAKDFYLRTRVKVEENPAQAAAIVGGAVAVLVGGIVLYRKYA